MLRKTLDKLESKNMIEKKKELYGLNPKIILTIQIECLLNLMEITLIS
ncbi:MAG: hypothetical protein CM15mP93_02530 [Thiotrichaceae bacterium]|nr:MAG: hypothetical protein CM15mP93_02530 [Thiotrichaceae bacterium]